MQMGESPPKTEAKNILSSNKAIVIQHTMSITVLLIQNFSKVVTFEVSFMVDVA